LDLLKPPSLGAIIKLSVIVTTYNKPVELRKVLDGLRFQSHRFPDEVIVADDGSGDETRELVEQMKTQYPCPLIHSWLPDDGFRLARSRNEAVKVATGDYIVILDGDCVPTQTFIEDHAALAEPGVFVQGKRVLIMQETSEDFTAHELVLPGFAIGAFFNKGYSNTHHLLPLPWFPASIDAKLKGIKGCNIGIFRDDILAVNGFNEDFKGWGREDSEFATRLYRYGLKRKIHPFRAICFHLWHKEAPREGLQKNDELLLSSMRSGEYRCKNGIEQD
jgi:glycosyltransferase involved in cell wall biosynthesis